MLKKYAYLLITAIFASVLITSCDDEDNPVIGGDEIEIETITIVDGTSIYSEAGSSVRLNGSYFGLQEGSVTISRDGTTSESLTVTQWQDVQVEFELPTDLVDGLYELTITRNDNEDSQDFELYVANDGEPEISSLTTLSAAADAVLVGFMPLGIEEWNAFDKYVVSYFSAGSDTMTVDIPSGTNQVIVDELTEGMVYTFMVTGMFTDGETMTNTVMKDWAPAARLTPAGVPALLFKSDNSTQGSGLDIFNPETGVHQVLLVSQGANWNFGIDTKTDGELYFGSADFLEYTFPTDPTNPGEFRLNSSNNITTLLVDGLDELDATFDNAFDTNDYITDAVELNSIDFSGDNSDKMGVVFVVRVPNGNSYNYARIFIERDMTDGDFFHVDGNDEHVRLYISYQKEVGVPFARI